MVFSTFYFTSQLVWGSRSIGFHCGTVLSQTDQWAVPNIALGTLTLALPRSLSCLGCTE